MKNNQMIQSGISLVESFSLKGYGQIYDVIWSPDGKKLCLILSEGNCIFLDAQTGVVISEENTMKTMAISWSPFDGKIAFADFDTIRFYDSNKNSVMREVDLNLWVSKLAWSKDGTYLAIGSMDGIVKIFDEKKSTTVEGIRTKGTIKNLVWTATNLFVFSSNRLYILDIKFLKNISEIGISDELSCSDVSPNGRFVAFGCGFIIRIFDMWQGMFINLEGHTYQINSLTFSSDNRFLTSFDDKGIIKIWNLDSWECIDSRETIPKSSNLCFHPIKNNKFLTVNALINEIYIWDFNNDVSKRKTRASVEYINAKVVLVGDSGVGKSGLGIRISENKFSVTESTHGAKFWQISVPEVKKINNSNNVNVELTLWDLAGQQDYHLIHQLFLDDTDAALLIFDCSNQDDPFKGVSYWSKVLGRRLNSHALKYLVSARTDVSPITIDKKTINNALKEFELHKYFKTCAKTGEGIEDLRKSIIGEIMWDKLTRTKTPILFDNIRRYLLQQKELGNTFVTLSKVQQQIKVKNSIDEVMTAIILLQSKGLVYLLKPTPSTVYILLKPELINQYASSIIRAARNHPFGLGAVSEREVVCANISLVGVDRLKPEEEKLILESTVELLIQHDLCFRELGMLVFPSQLNSIRPEIDKLPPVEVTYSFSGSVETIYASLVVRLGYTNYFVRENQWKYVSEFSREGLKLGFIMRQIKEGTAELDIYFNQGVNDFDRITFIRFITDHLDSKGIEIHEEIKLYCKQCGKEVVNRDAIQVRIEQGELDITCQYCDNKVMITRSIEEHYRKNSVYPAKQEELQKTVKERTKEEVQSFKDDNQQYKKDVVDQIHILHLSDLHLSTSSEAKLYRVQLETDLIQELKVNRLEYLVISGDVANKSTQEEYMAAFEFIDGLVKKFGLDSSRLIITPGNHDLNWDLAQNAYNFIPKFRLPNPLTDDFILPDANGAFLKDENKYKERFSNFNNYFYKKIYGSDYPKEYAKQGILKFCEKDKIIFLDLNSSWEIDHFFPVRAGINNDALANTIESLLQQDYREWLKIVILHHPVTGSEAIKNDFLELLAVHGFQICLHGHIHEALEAYYNYDAKRKIHIIGAGTFGAPTSEQMPSIPLQYNLLRLDRKEQLLRVDTRKKEKPDGSWSADARWGEKNSPKSWYEFKIK